LNGQRAIMPVLVWYTPILTPVYIPLKRQVTGLEIF